LVRATSDRRRIDRNVPANRGPGTGDAGNTAGTGTGRVPGIGSSRCVGTRRSSSAGCGTDRRRGSVPIGRGWSSRLGLDPGVSRWQGEPEDVGQRAGPAVGDPRASRATSELSTGSADTARSTNASRPSCPLLGSRASTMPSTNCPENRTRTRTPGWTAASRLAGTR
jgi:hypothetical protein